MKLRLKNITYYEGDVKKVLPKVISDENVIVLDPARSGCDKSILEIINNSKVTKVIYISCNPSTLARDLCKLVENFEIKEFSLFEMFPNTKHIESLVLLNRKN